MMYKRRIAEITEHKNEIMFCCNENKLKTKIKRILL